MKANLFLLTMSVFSVLGLSSCTQHVSQESPNAPSSAAPASPQSPQSQPGPSPTAPSAAAPAPAAPPAPPEDTWKLPRPQIQTVRDGQAGPLDLFSAAMKPIDADARLVFPIRDASEFQGVKLQIKTICQSSGGELKSEIELFESADFSLNNVLPVEVFLLNSLGEAEGLICDLDFVATNSRGSVHHFSLPQIKFTHFETLQNLSLYRVLANQSVVENLLAPKFAEILASAAESWRILPAPENRMNREAYLICGHFRNHRSVSSDQSLDGIAQQLINGSIEYATPPAFDPRASFTRQVCHMVVRAKDSASQQVTTMLTPSFQLDYHGVQTTATSGFAQFSADAIFSNVALSERPFYAAEISNASAAPIAVRITNSLNPGLEIQDVFVLSPGSPARVSQTYAMPVALKIAGATRQWSDGADVIFELGPWSKATVNLQVISDWRCSLSNAGMFETLKSGGLGFNYRMNSKIEFFQLVNWDPINVRFDSPAINITPLSLPTGIEPNGHLSGWFSSRSWLNLVGSNPPGEPTPPEPVAACQIGPAQIHF